MIYLLVCSRLSDSRVRASSNRRARAKSTRSPPSERGALLSERLEQTVYPVDSAIHCLNIRDQDNTCVTNPQSGCYCCIIPGGVLVYKTGTTFSHFKAGKLETSETRSTCLHSPEKREKKTKQKTNKQIKKHMFCRPARVYAHHLNRKCIQRGIYFSTELLLRMCQKSFLCFSIQTKLVIHEPFGKPVC